jgi:hypothetical protein
LSSSNVRIDGDSLKKDRTKTSIDASHPDSSDNTDAAMTECQLPDSSNFESFKRTEAASGDDKLYNRLEDALMEEDVDQVCSSPCEEALLSKKEIEASIERCIKNVNELIDFQKVEALKEAKFNEVSNCAEHYPRM